MLTLFREITFGATSGLVYSPKSSEELNEIDLVFRYLENQEYRILYDLDLFKAIPLRYQSKWPVHKVRWWSRPYEYSFILSNILSQYNSGARKIFELGPGCSIIPFILASELPDIDITLCDTDPDALAFQKAAFESIGFSRYSLISSFCPQDLYSEQIFYSVSVLEHCPNPTELLLSILSSLPDASICLCTLDIDLRSGKHGISWNHYGRLMLEGMPFSSTTNIILRHKSQLLTNENGWFFRVNADQLAENYRSPHRTSPNKFKSVISSLADLFNYKSPKLAVAKLKYEIKK